MPKFNQKMLNFIKIKYKIRSKALNFSENLSIYIQLVNCLVNVCFCGINVVGDLYLFFGPIS